MGDVIWLAQTIDGAYRDLYNATKQYQAQEMRYIELESDLEQQQYVALASGQVVGKNEAERNACLYMMFQELNNELTAKKITKTAAQHEMVLAQLELDRLLKISELER